MAGQRPPSLCSQRAPRFGQLLKRGRILRLGGARSRRFAAGRCPRTTTTRVTVAACFWVICSLLGLSDKPWESVDDPEDEVEAPQVEVEFLKSFPRFEDRGTSQWVTMSFKKWNRTYWRSAKDGPSGVVMLLIHKAPGKAREWTALDPVGRVQLINPKDKHHASTKAKGGVTYTDHAGLSAHDKDEAEQASQRLLDRMKGATIPGPKKKAAPKFKSKKLMVLPSFSATRLATSVGLWAWARKSWGPLAGAVVGCWRAWVYFGLSEWVRTGYQAYEEGREWIEYLGEWKGVFDEMRESGELDFWIMTGVAGLLAIWGYYTYGQPDRGSSYDGPDSDDDSLCGDPVSDTESEGEPTLAGLAEDDPRRAEAARRADRDIQDHEGVGAFGGQ